MRSHKSSKKLQDMINNLTNKIAKNTRTKHIDLDQKNSDFCEIIRKNQKEKHVRRFLKN